MPFCPPSNRARLGELLFAALLAAATLACGPSQESPPGPTAPAASERPPSGGGLAVVPGEGEDPARPGYFDFGEVPGGAIVHHTFVLENTDPRPVTLQKVDPGCGCTVARIAKRLQDGSLEPALSDRPNELMHLEPGDVMEVALRVDTGAIKKKNTDKLFMVRLASDSIRRPFLTLECHLVVRQRFQLAPESLELGPIAIGGGKLGQITLKALGPELFRITGLGPLPPGVVAELEKSPIGGPDGVIWLLRAGFAAPLERGRIATTITLHTEDAQGSPGGDIKIQVAGTGVDDVTVTPSRLILRPSPRAATGLSPEASPARVEAELTSHLEGQRFRVTGYTIEGQEADNLRLEATALQPSPDGSSGRWSLALEAKAAPTLSAFTGTVLLELDDPQFPRIELPYAGLGF